MTKKNTVANSLEEDELVIAQLEQEELEPSISGEEEIEAKYMGGQANIYIQRNDFLIPNILQMVQNREVLDISPSYQRRMRWNEKKKSHLIESLLMNVPIPPIFLYERDFAQYEVMDGQQRLSAIKTFFANEFKLQDLLKWSELNGRYYEDLPPKIRAGLQRRGLPAVIILTESTQDKKTSMELRQYVFERLNTGGERLNAQEVRNCIYSSAFNDILIKIARSRLFTSVWDIPPKEPNEPQHVSQKLATNRLYSTMADCEIVLRYFALSDMSNFNKGMKQTLDDFMKLMLKESKRTCDNLRQEYMGILETAQKIYGAHLFRLIDKNNELRGRRSLPLADAVLLGIRPQVDRSKRLIENKNYILDATKRLMLDAATYDLLISRANTKQTIEDRISIMKKVFSDAVHK